jgi:SAM-dependent methyltransferase
VGSLVRKKQYTTRIHQGDYFVVKYLQLFIKRQLNQLIAPGCLVGDIGCGEQPLRELIEALGGIYTGIDIEQNSQNTVQVIASITNVPLPDSHFDVILCTEVLEHVSDTDAAFCELARLLKPGGKMVVTVPFAYPLHEEPYDFVRLTPYQIRECARNTRLEIVELEVSGNELEVMATVWSNMWDRMIVNSKPGVARRIRGAVYRLMYLAVNLLAAAGSLAMGRVLPKKFYLNVLCVLARSEVAEC